MPAHLSAWHAFCSPAVLLIIALSLFVSLGMLDSYRNYQLDKKYCDMTYMRPSYRPYPGFNSEYHRFSTKYSLYLYRESGYDDETKELTGIPVLFIHGNAGYYMQVRSIASVSATYYRENFDYDKQFREEGMLPLDIFTLDLNEEFTALHGQSLMEQAEYVNHAIQYILSLYPMQRSGKYAQVMAHLPRPSSVMLVGHSMGGIVARTAFTLDNYIRGSVNTVITLSSPHAAPPVYLDWGIAAIYERVNEFWRIHALADDSLDNPLRDIVLVSIAGGTADKMINSDLTEVKHLISDDKGFTVFTTNIPHVWSTMDHECILWCKSMTDLMSKALLDIVDARRPQQTTIRSERMKRLKARLYSGLEAEKTHLGKEETLRMADLYVVETDKDTVRFTGKTLSDKPSAMVFKLPETLEGVEAFAIWSDQEIGQAFPIALHLCKDQKLDYTCRQVASNSHYLPDYSRDQTRVRISSSYNQVLSSDFHAFTHLLVTLQPNHEFSFIYGGFIATASTTTLDTSPLDLVVYGAQVKDFPHDGSMFPTLRVPSIVHPLLAYRMRIRSNNCPTIGSLHIWQAASFTSSTKFLKLNPSQLVASTSKHGLEVTADIHYYGEPNDFQDIYSTSVTMERGALFRFLLPPSCEQLDVRIKVDVYGSLGQLARRYDLTIIALAYSQCLLVLLLQLLSWNERGVWISFPQAFAKMATRVFPLLLVIVSLIMSLRTPSTPVTHPWLLTIILNLAAMTFMLIAWSVVMIAVLVVSAILGAAQSMVPSLRNMARPKSTIQRLRRRAITTAALFLVVSFWLPSQFAFVVALFIQLLSTCYSFLDARHTSDGLNGWNKYYFHHSILLLIFSCFPYTAPVLAAWVRNLSVMWMDPASYDHSLVAIAPMILLAESTSTGILPRIPSKYIAWPTYLLLVLTCLYTQLGSTRHAFTVYSSCNLIILWLLATSTYARSRHPT